MNKINEILGAKILNRDKEGLLRKLTIYNGLIDFCSNDYLGLAREKGAPYYFLTSNKVNGSTGSRLISGNTQFAEDLENTIAEFHQSEAGLLYNSGYDANLGLFSCVPQRGDTIIFDELVHASVRDGVRLSFASNYSFRHNDLLDLENRLSKANGNVFVAVESYYSMDGDFAPLIQMVKLCEKYGANLIVDEAHSTGVFGMKGAGIVQKLKLQDKVFARVHTFGKALGCHGAIVLGSKMLRDYQINYSRPFIFSTALPPHSLVQIRLAYKQIKESEEKREKLFSNINYFKSRIEGLKGYFEITDCNGPIQCIIIPGNERARALSLHLIVNGLDVRPILYPTVQKGKERIRICLHAFNTKEEMNTLVNVLKF